MNRRENLPVRVLVLLHSREEGCPTLRMVACSLRMSSRTLNRRLQARGFSFRNLQSGVRYARTLQLMCQRDLSIDEIAARLGYSNQANFTRVFRRWTGRAPSVFRQQL